MFWTLNENNIRTMFWSKILITCYCYYNYCKFVKYSVRDNNIVFNWLIITCPHNQFNELNCWKKNATIKMNKWIMSMIFYKVYILYMLGIYLWQMYKLQCTYSWINWTQYVFVICWIKKTEKMIDIIIYRNCN